MSILQETTSPMDATLTRSTRYFEIDSVVAGARYGVWVCTPARYDREEISYPAIYQPDGNGVASVMARMMYLRDDPINPHVPFISVCVGYIGDEAHQGLAVRARDLIPPGEAIEVVDEETFVAACINAGFLDEHGARTYWFNLNNPAADRFLAFLEAELHPLLKAEYRIDDSALGLFGHSFGGTFAAWVATQRSMFRRICASSPGITPATSKVLEAYDKEFANEEDHSGRMLHVAIAEKEITAPSSYATNVGRGTSELFHRLATTPLKGLEISTRIVPDESHFTVNYVALASYLRTCYSATETTGLI